MNGLALPESPYKGLMPYNDEVSRFCRIWKTAPFGLA